MDEWTQTLGAGPLLGIAAGAIALTLILVIWLKLHAFLVLIIASLITALTTGVPVDKIVATMTEGFGGTLGSVALLVGLGAMLGRLVETSGGAQSLADALIRLLGETPVALLISVLVAALALRGVRGQQGSALEKTLDSALGPVCSVILVTGAGGMFGGVLRASGIGDALASTMGDIGVPVVLACFLISLILRVAQGSATVALVTTAGLMSATVAAGGFNDVQIAAIVLVTAAGSVAASHVNDSGFWLIGRLVGMDVPTTLRTWTVMETVIAVVGFALSAIVFYTAGALG